MLVFPLSLCPLLVVDPVPLCALHQDVPSAPEIPLGEAYIRSLGPEVSSPTLSVVQLALMFELIVHRSHVPTP